MTTIYEIAKRAKVSIGTVDRVLHKRGRVSKETEEKVRQIILELNYKPSVYARGLALSKTYLFGILMPEPTQDGCFWQLPEVGIRKAQNELKVYNIEIKHFFYDKYSIHSFQQACASILAHPETFDGLLIAPVLSRFAEDFIKNIPHNIPYVFFDSYLPNVDCLTFIGQKSFQSGVLSGKLMSILVGRDATIAVIRILPEDYHLEDRVGGFQSFFSQDPGIRIRVYEADLMKGQEAIHAVTRRILEENGDLGGLFVPSACTGNVAEFIHSRNGQSPIRLIGYDLTDENIRFMKEGVIDFLISQRPEIQGYRGIHALYRHVVLKEAIPREMILPIDIVTRENIDYYINEIV
ncbi:substrate-binding domain-containing protein [bacterium]|nr:substrate-binding domain-containing protein [bacterium]